MPVANLLSAIDHQPVDAQLERPVSRLFLDQEPNLRDVFALTHEGRITSRFGLPDGVKCIVADDVSRIAEFMVYAVFVFGLGSPPARRTPQPSAARRSAAR